MSKPSEPHAQIVDSDLGVAPLGMNTASGLDPHNRFVPTAPKARRWRLPQGARMVLETLVVVAIVTAIEWRWQATSAQALGLSLYWIPVALMSGQYGSRAGLFATLAATAADLGVHLPARLAEQDYFEYIASVSALPSAWLVYALVLGGLRDLHAGKEANARSELAETRDAAEHIADGLERALSENNKLEMRIASDRSTLDGFVRALAKFRVYSDTDFYPSFAELVREATSAEIVDVFIRRGDSYPLVAQICTLDGAPPATAAAPPSLISLINTTRKAVHWESPAAPLRGMQGACAAPIVGDMRSVVQGVLIVYLAAPNDDLHQTMRRAERLGQLLGNLLDALEPAVAEHAVAV